MYKAQIVIQPSVQGVDWEQKKVREIQLTKVIDVPSLTVHSILSTGEARHHCAGVLWDIDKGMYMLLTSQNFENLFDLRKFIEKGGWSLEVKRVEAQERIGDWESARLDRHGILDG